MKKLLTLSICLCVVILQAQLTVPTGFSSSTVCTGQPVYMATSVSGGVPPYSYTWVVQGTCGGTITGANAPTVAATPTCTGFHLYLVFIQDAALNSKWDSVSMVTTNGGALNITAAANPTSVCAGGTSNLLSSGATTYSWSTGGTGNSIMVSPTVTTTYSVYGTSASCTNIQTVTVVVGSPNISVTGPTSICAGSTVVLTASGAGSYTWSTGANGSSVSVSPLVNTVYTVNGSGSGCNGSTTKTIQVIASKNLSGAVTSTAGTVNGVVKLYRVGQSPSMWTLSDSSTISSSAYSMPSIKSGTYVVKAFPTDTMQQPTYGSSSVSWQGATLINHGCAVNSTQNINVIPYLSIGNGPGSLAGKIMEGNGYGQKMATPGNPIGGVTVKGGKNPGGNIVGRTVTNSAGQYSLSNLPQNQTGESYFLIVDIPGLDTNNTYHRIIIDGAANYANLDFIVDSAKINPVDVNVGLQEIKSALGTLKLFPNPAKSHVTIAFDAKKTGELVVQLFDIYGRLVKNYQETVTASSDITIRLDVNLIDNGIYLVKIKLGEELYTNKILINH